MLALSNPAMTARLTGHPNRDHRAVPMQHATCGLSMAWSPSTSGLTR
jgi:hypothetical protein